MIDINDDVSPSPLVDEDPGEVTDREVPTFREHDFPVYLPVFSRKPSKWILVDLETGEIYRGKDRAPYYWKKLNRFDQLDAERQRRLRDAIRKRWRQDKAQTCCLCAG